MGRHEFVFPVLQIVRIDAITILFLLWIKNVSGSRENELIVGMIGAVYSGIRIDKRVPFGGVMAGQKFDERREYVRVGLSTQVRIQPVTRQEFERHKTVQLGGASDDISLGGSDMPNTRLGYLAERLIRIEEKVDRILWKLDPESRPDEAATYGTAQNISGAGVSLSLNESMEVGQLVLISISVPGFSIGFLHAYGEVVRVSPSKEKRKQLFDTSIRFLIIDESEREKLISYAFYKQRQEIRSLAMAKDKNRE